MNLTEPVLKRQLEASYRALETLAREHERHRGQLLERDAAVERMQLQRADTIAVLTKAEAEREALAVEVAQLREALDRAEAQLREALDRAQASLMNAEFRLQSLMSAESQLDELRRETAHSYLWGIHRAIRAAPRARPRHIWIYAGAAWARLRQTWRG